LERGRERGNDGWGTFFSFLRERMETYLNLNSAHEAVGGTDLLNEIIRNASL
jgi:hypothetical protein